MKIGKIMLWTIIICIVAPILFPIVAAFLLLILGTMVTFATVSFMFVLDFFGII